jgi:uncharacterized protein YfbU (UPF0304 family)
MYTANLASMLTIDAQKIQRYNNLHEIIQAGEQVCVQEVRKETSKCRLRTSVFPTGMPIIYHDVIDPAAATVLVGKIEELNCCFV